MKLEDKIKQILEAASVPNDGKKPEAGKGDKSDKKDDKGGDTDLAKDSTKKDGADVKESVVPGTDALLGTQQKETLSGAEQELSGAGKTAKLVAKYDKGTKQPDVKDVATGGSTDSKASDETNKIQAQYKMGTSQGKLKEDAFAALFAGEELTEDFKIKAEAIFEAAVEQVAEAKVQALQEEHQQQLTEAVEAVKGELVEQIDGYLDQTIEKWLQDNAVALESGIKVEMVSSFMENMKNVFTEHYIDVPESKINVVEEQAKEIESLQSELAEAKALAEKAVVEAQILKCEAVIAEASEGLTAIEAEKLKTLAESVEFETEEEFAAKVKALKESYFRKSKTEDVKTPTQESTTASIVESKTHSDVEAVMNVLRKADADAIKFVRSTN